MRTSAEVVVSGEIDPSAVLWSGPPAERGGRELLVLLHGYGSNETDLFGRLVPLLPADLIVASLRGPVTEESGFAWVSLAKSVTMLTDGAVLCVANEVAQAVLDWLHSIPTFGSVGLLGESQGAVMALHLLRMAPGTFSYVVNLSGYILAGVMAGDADLQKTLPPVFWRRGRGDEVIPREYVERTARWLPGHAATTVRVDDAGHQQTEAGWVAAAQFTCSQVRRGRQTAGG